MTSFAPISEHMIHASLVTYGTVAKAVSGVALVIFSVRLSISATLLGQPKDYADALKSLIIFFIAIASAPLIFKAVCLTTSQIAETLQVAETQSASKGLSDQIFDLFKEDSPVLMFFIELGPNIISALAFAIYSLLLGTVIAIAPFIFLHQLLSHESSAVMKVFGSFVALTSWPILWNAIGLLSHNLWPSFSSTTLSSIAFSFAVKLLQVLSPLFSAMLIKQMSVSGAGKSITIMNTIKKVAVKKK